MDLQKLLDFYTPHDETEVAMKAQLQHFLEAASTNEAAFGRELAGSEPDWGHVTGSAWVVNATGTQTVLVHHAKLGKWVQPGGHCDGDCDVLRVALREAREETGLDVRALESGIFDIDVHRIPEYWNTPEHAHFDVRFLLLADEDAMPQRSAESRAVRWVSLEEVMQLNNTSSIIRMIEKTQRRFASTK
jgi:8-oxo-dGTP pyrophosphatase MutT (NUDIX family)